MSSGSYRKEYKKAQTAAKATVKAAISMSLRNTDISYYCLLLSRTSVGSPVNTLRWNRESDEKIMSLSNDSSVYSGVSSKGERTPYPRSEWCSKSALASTALDSFTVT